jgi:L-amino acid N-acyltransferase YncA
MNIRQATPSDADQLLEIYRPIVETTAFSFELIPPTADEFAERIAASIDSHDWIVMEATSGLCGYAYATPHRAREAYKHSVETSVYIHDAHRGKGVGKRLYEALFVSLKSLDYHNAYAGITLPNSASIALHRSFGFEPVGVFREVGFKQGDWHDVSWWQRQISS